MSPRKNISSEINIAEKLGVIYARYSSHNQKEESIEQQVEECMEFAANNNIKIIQIYADKALSGKTDKRPQFQHMMRDAEKRQFNVVVAYKSNRIARNMLHALEYENRLAKYNIETLYAKEEFGSDFVFVTHYPSKKRPFYAMDDPADSTYTLSFDLLYKGLEITTGGQRIHQYDKLMEKIAQRGMETEGMEHYLSAFKYGMPPHGGLGIGMERLTMQLIGEDNVREATLFPRDLSRLEP